MGKKTNRCTKCRKKVGFLGIQCRCKDVFCDGCRDPEEHGCSFDFFTHHQDVLKKRNPKIVAEKVERIGGTNTVE